MLLTRLARLAVNWQSIGSQLTGRLNGRFAIGSIDKAIKWAICHWLN